jgi:hypothetical protein
MKTLLTFFIVEILAFLLAFGASYLLFLLILPKKISFEAAVGTAIGTCIGCIILSLKLAMVWHQH